MGVALYCCITYMSFQLDSLSFHSVGKVTHNANEKAPTVDGVSLVLYHLSLLNSNDVSRICMTKMKTHQHNIMISVSSEAPV